MLENIILSLSIYICFQFKDPLATEIKGVPFLQDNKETMLEKVQYVTSIGIYKADMR